MSKVFQILMIFSFLASVCLAECIPVCIACFVASVLFGFIAYGLEMRK